MIGKTSKRLSATLDEIIVKTKYCEKIYRSHLEKFPTVQFIETETQVSSCILSITPLCNSSLLLAVDLPWNM